MTTRNILVQLAYDGTFFNGYQVQAKGERTVQGVFGAALERLHGRPVTSYAAGRTDSGVHADAQYVSFHTDLGSIPAEKFLNALNRYLPADAKVQSSREVPADFHARYSAKSRAYKYFILPSVTPIPKYRNYAYKVSFNPSLERLNVDAEAIVGEQDFTTFAAAGQSTDSNVRTVLEATFTEEPPFVVFSIRANGFLWKMVRSLVGTLIEREEARWRGVESLSPMRELIEARERGRAGTTAPPQGLFLTDVEYDV